MSTTYFSSIKLRNAGTVLTVSDPNAITTSSLTSTISGLNTRLDAIEESITSLIGRLEAVEAFGTRITAIEEALANQGGNEGGNDQPGGNDEPGGDTPSEPEEPTTPEYTPIHFKFTSYADAAKTIPYATGEVETTGNTTTFDSEEYSEVEVIENTIEGFVGQKFFVNSNAKVDGTTTTQLYNAEGAGQGIWVTMIFAATTEPIHGGWYEPSNDFVSTTYEFTSYADSAKTTQYAVGTARTTGVTAVDNINQLNFTEIEVLTNSVADFVGQRFLILSNATTDGETANQLYDNTFTGINIWVTIS